MEVQLRVRGLSGAVPDLPISQRRVPISRCPQAADDLEAICRSTFPRRPETVPLGPLGPHGARVKVPVPRTPVLELLSLELREAYRAGCRYRTPSRGLFIRLNAQNIGISLGSGGSEHKAKGSVMMSES